MFVPTLRRAIKMNTTCSPFSRAVISAMRKLYPEHLADKSWDNTGLLLEAPFNPQRRQKNSVLLAVDLTKAVVDEAIERKDSIIVAYHPIIFRGLKAITLNDSQQTSLLRLAAEGISVYSPHTAFDAAPGGLGDWLADIITGTARGGPNDEEPSEVKDETAETEESDPFVDGKRPTYMLQHHPSQRKIKDADLSLGAAAHTRSVIKPSNLPDIPDAGMGRIVRFNQPQQLSTIIHRIARGVGNPKGFPIAIPQGKSVKDITIRSAAICAGSGGSLFSGLDDIDLLFTGELAHHDALAAIERGQCVITLFHSNTERGFLHTVLRNQLMNKVKEEWTAVRREGKEMLHTPKEFMDILDDESVSIETSERDRDPYGLIIATE
ncbi:YbgI/family dinuclear metal center protein [Verruconis gallopava]|uniref:YbgI/family dinuclear metal center protein n=1 Tax=Verruconis gallopava TaxID=253628 RepID=A0A0D2A8W8_9PEZI|nr:YbgI/family dinuclear metal center protein [Verruconis gallopava]KIW02995.1 YbgI/family dinuclear metal center protein [Verruconis gallopava]